jgi:hypothetical protein
MRSAYASTRPWGAGTASASLAPPSRVPLDPVQHALGGTPLRDPNRPDPVQAVLAMLILLDLLVLFLKL